MSAQARVTTLNNGLRIASDAMAGLETAAVGVWVNAGARNEASDVNGVSHMLEHMAFKGTARRGALDIAREIEAVGGHLNAYTSREQTAYFARILKGDLPLAVDILSDILQHSTFDQTELNREQAVVVQEIGQTNDTPDDLVFDHFQEAAFPGQPVGRSILGTAERVRGFGRETLFDYMSAHYLGPGMIVAAAGGIDHDELVEIAGPAFEAISAGAPPKPAEAAYEGGESRVERELEQVHYLLGFAGLTYDDPDFYAAQVLATVLGGGMSSRLFQEVREKRGLAYSVFAFSASYVDSGLFGVYAGTAPDDVADLVPVLCDEICRAAEDIAEDETAKARAQHKAGILMGLEAAGARVEHLGRQMLIFGGPIPPAELTAKIDAVDAAALRRVAARLVSSRPVVSAIGPLRGLEDYQDTLKRLA